jgi:DNA-binding CsgD family transcriptional regulator
VRAPATARTAALAGPWRRPALTPNAGPRVELSAQERRVLALVASGARDADIAAELAISIRTVRSYLDRIRDKTGRRRRPELTRFAIEEGIAHLPPGS